MHTVDDSQHERFMREALKEAHLALQEQEIPVGAVITLNNRIIARAHNQVERLRDVTAHAEMIAITAAANYLGAKYLEECTLFVTIEPCLMCATALYWSHIPTIYYGASDNRFGYTRYTKTLFGKKVKIYSGLLAEECANLMLHFFRQKRKLHDGKSS
ncbi:MAG: tRNA-specific adenosine deaminase [Chitinophagales bacterium]|nr:MAG: tRNA-specific adenosine deaminase [Chitinophagales bacterium]